MYIRILTLAVFIIFIVGNIHAQTPAVSICNYLDNKAAAVSITFDDGCKDQFLIGQPIMDNLGFNATFFIITDYTTGFASGCSYDLTWGNLQNAVNKGHEIASHTVHHPLLDTLYIKYGADTVESELRKSRDSLNKYVTGQKVITFAYPEGDGDDNTPASDSVRKILHKYYIGARAAGVCDAGYDTYSYATGTGFDDFYYQVESYPNYDTTTLVDYKNKLDGAIQNGGWFLPMYHTFNENDYLSVTTSAFTNQMNAINARKNSLWIAPFRNVLKYHKEKVSANATLSQTSYGFVISLTDTISNPEFDMPLTLLVSNLGCICAVDSIKQGSNNLSFSIVGESVQFNAVPNKGNINIYKSTIVVPTLATNSVSTITSSSASSGGNITNDGKASISGRGVCWSTTPNPTITNTFTNDGTGTGSFTSSIVSLSANTTYYVRAYATNSAGTGYGNEVSFVTEAPVLPILTTAVVSSVTSSSGSSGGDITDDGGASINSRGVCWSTLSNPTISDNKSVNGNGMGNFTSSIINLNSNTTYYVRAYAVNSAGTAYGNELSFTTATITPSPTLPVLTTNACSSITSSGAISGGNVTDDGNAAITSKGVCWSITSDPTLLDSKTDDGTGEGTFTSSITNLTSGTVYYVRGYATNSVGTAYGNIQSFTTSVSTGIGDYSLSNNISVYPNPSMGLFHLTMQSYDSPLLELKIINVEGRVIYRENLDRFYGNYSKDLDLRNLINGIYCLQIVTGKDHIMRKIFIQ